MNKKIIMLFITSLVAMTMAGCGSSDNQVNFEETTSETAYVASGDRTEVESNTLASAESNFETENTEEAVSGSFVSANIEASIVENEFAESNSDVSAEETSSIGYSIEDINRLYTNYIQSELTNVDISKIDIDVWFSDDLYWVDTFQDNETDSMHPVKSGSAYMDPVTGIGKFWIWGGYDDPDAIDVDFSKYDY